MIRDRIIEALRRRKHGIGPVELASIIGANLDEVREALRELHDEGIVIAPRGWLSWDGSRHWQTAALAEHWQDEAVPV